MTRKTKKVDSIAMALHLQMPVSGEEELDYHIRQAKRLRIATRVLAALAYRSDLQGNMRLAAEASLNMADALIAAWKAGDGGPPPKAKA